MPELLIKGARIVDPIKGPGDVQDVLISRGSIAGLGGDIATDGRDVIDGSGMALFPGFLDLHAHLREPGREEAETLETGLESALRGGYTAVCCMPNTNPPLDNSAVVEGLFLRARGLGLADLFPIGCISRNREGRLLAEMALMHASAAAVRAFSDDGNGVVDSGLMRRALEYVSAFGGLIISHAEDPTLSLGGQVNEGAVSNELGLRGIPALAEEVMTARDILIAETTGSRLHLAHVSTARCVEMVREAKARGVGVTAEVTPHHLLLSDRDIPAYDTAYKVNPPLRSPEDIRELRVGLEDGTIDAIATDHAPHTIEDKEQEFDYAPFGVVGFESSFPVLFTELVEKECIGLKRLVELLTTGPARVMGLTAPDYSPVIGEGSGADLVLIDLDEEWELDVSSFASKGRNCPFDGRRVRGRVRCTIKNGKVRYRLGGRGGRIGG